MYQADISQEEWDRYRGQLIRTAGLVEGLEAQLKSTIAGLELVRVEMRSLRTALSQFKHGVAERLDKHSDWKETTGKHELAELEQQVKKYEHKEEQRLALWIKIALGLLAAVAEGGILHLLKW